MCPVGLPVSGGVLELRSPTLKGSFPAGRAVQPRLPDRLCCDALPWSLQKFVDSGVLEPPGNTRGRQSPFPGERGR